MVGSEVRVGIAYGIRAALSYDVRNEGMLEVGREEGRRPGARASGEGVMVYVVLCRASRWTELDWT